MNKNEKSLAITLAFQLPLKFTWKLICIYLSQILLAMLMREVRLSTITIMNKF